jgi:hypothetical protein
LNIKQFWEITDHGPIKWFFGFEIRRDRKAKTILIYQWAYIELMIEKFRLTNAKNVLTPMDPNTHFSVQQCPSTINQMARMKGVLYSKALGLVLWPTVVLCPDTAYAVDILLQFMQNLGPAHWEGIKRVINYLGHTKDLWLTFGGKKQEMLKGYCNAD